MIHYEPNPEWAAYYDELEPKKRLQQFNAIAMKHDSRETAFQRQLWEERYHDPKHPDRQVDLWLWKCVYLPGLYKRRHMPFSGFQREVRKTLEELHLEHPDALTEPERMALYLEFRNTARRYLSTCRGDRYGRKWMGLKAATWKEQQEKASEDIWMMSRGIALASGLEQNTRLLCDAFHEELLRFHPDCGIKYDELEAQYQKGRI